MDIFPDYEIGLNEILRIIRSTIYCKNAYVEKSPDIDFPQNIHELKHFDKNLANLFNNNNLVNKIIKSIDNNLDKYIVIKGERLSGKTLLLNQLRNKLNLNRYLPLRLSCSDFLNNSNVAKYFADQIINEINIFRREQYNDNFPDINDMQIENSDSFINKFWKKIMQIIGHLKPVLMFDDMEKLIELKQGYNQVISFIQKIINDISIKNNALFIFTINNNPKFYYPEPLDKFMDKGKKFSMKYYENAVQTIFSAIPDYKYDQNEIKIFESYFDGHPFLLSSFYEAFSDYIYKKQTKSNDFFKNILQNVVEDNCDSIISLWEGLFEEEKIIIQIVSNKLLTDQIADKISFTFKELINIKNDNNIQINQEKMELGINCLKVRKWIKECKRTFVFALGIIPFCYAQHKNIIEEQNFIRRRRAYEKI